MSENTIITLAPDLRILALSNDASGLDTGQCLSTLLVPHQINHISKALDTLETLPSTCFQVTLNGHRRTLSAVKYEENFCLTLHRLSADPIAESFAGSSLNEGQIDALRQSNAQLSDFVHLIAHQLKEPLRQVASYAELIADAPPEFLSENPDITGFVVEGAQRADRLVSELLAYSRLDRGNSTNVTMINIEAQSLVEHVVQEYRNSAEVKVGNLPQIQADHEQFRQVVNHLVENAVRFGAKNVEISALDEDDEVRFCIEDDGIGIAPKDHERIFAIFTTLNSSEEYEGIGLGLALCERIIDRWGGRLGLESKLGEGSTFYFTVPKRQSEGTTLD